jgi:hypothetical protein
MADDWNECLPWDGEENSLPVGEQIRIPNFRAVDLVRRWEVLDVESDSGFRLVTTCELKPEDRIIGCQINENSFAKIVETYGRRFFVAAKADPKGRLLDRWEWKEAFGSDVLELEALKQIRQGKRVFKVGK